jgi:hypothetical protein
MIFTYLLLDNIVSCNWYCVYVYILLHIFLYILDNFHILWCVTLVDGMKENKLWTMNYVTLFSMLHIVDANHIDNSLKWKINTCSLAYQTGISRTLVVFVFRLYSSHYYTKCKIVRYHSKVCRGEIICKMIKESRCGLANELPPWNTSRSPIF